MNNKKKGPSWLTILVIGAAIFLSAADVIPEDVYYGAVGLIVMLVPVLLVILLVRFVIRRLHAAPEGHSHDRIDHSSDLKINPQTGRAESAPIRPAAPHSAKEHWKQQLDSLLDNGTIDKTEYRAMMNRKF